MATETMRIITWELIKRLDPGEAGHLLDFLSGYLWRCDDFYKAVAAWLETREREREKAADEYPYPDCRGYEPRGGHDDAKARGNR